MIQKIRSLQYYVRVFREVVAVDGWSLALRKAARFVRRRVRSSLLHKVHMTAPVEIMSGYRDIVETLGSTPVRRTLLLIVSDTQIRQCVHYRIHQKMRYLDVIGVKTMHLMPTETGRLRAYLGLAHTVILYRTALPEAHMQELRNSAARLVFEFDDLVVGRPALEKSGILSQITDTQAAHLLALSDRFLNTAQACDAIIVSTPHLAEIYARPENGLGGKPVLVVPNFVETDIYSAPGPKDVTFAFTSPSGSIRRELSMLKDFLAGYDSTADRDWTILVMGNEMARVAIEEIPFRRGRVIACPFSAFDDYLYGITRAETVLIPLSDNDFNRAKTAIRLIDAAVSGTQALFSPVGAYCSIQAELHEGCLSIPSESWGEAGTAIAPVLARLDKNVADLQQAVRRVYGIEAAKSCYRQVFLSDLGINPTTTAERSVAA